MNRFVSLLFILLAAGCASTPESAKVKEPTGPAVVENPDGSITAIVKATDEWVTIGQVAEGETLEFRATGQWGESRKVNRSADGGAAGMFGSGYWGVQAVNPSSPWGALVGRVGNHSFLVGQANIIKATQAGFLQLSINDGLGHRQDNHGFLTVTIKRRK